MYQGAGCRHKTASAVESVFNASEAKWPLFKLMVAYDLNGHGMTSTVAMQVKEPLNDNLQALKIAA